MKLQKISENINHLRMYSYLKMGSNEDLLAQTLRRFPDIMVYPEPERSDGMEWSDEDLQPGTENFKVEKLPEELWGKGLCMVTLSDGSQFVVEPFTGVYYLQQLDAGSPLEEVKAALEAAHREVKDTADDRQSVEDLIHGLTAAKYTAEDHACFVDLMSAE